MAKLVYASHSKCDNYSYEGSSPSLLIIIIKKYIIIHMSLLVLGGTGTLGRQIVRRGLDEGFHVKCLVRNFRKAAFLKEWGAELVYGDLKSPETVPLALFGITAIIDASTARPSDLYNASQIDLHGKYILVEAAKRASIKRYIFFSILNASEYNEIPLMNFKVRIEQLLDNSSLAYTIFKLPGFFQGLIGQYALPILEKKSVWITKTSIPIKYIDTQDIAKFAIRSLSVKNSKNTVFSLVGHTSWSSTQIIEICEKLSGQRCKVSYVPINFLRFARECMKFFQWTWNISERLAFTEVLSKGYQSDKSMKDAYNVLNIDENATSKLEIYLQDYFTRVMRKLKELNYKMDDPSDNTIF